VLEVTGLHAYYGLSHVLQGISLKVIEGQVACLLGRNGAGKSTTLKSIMGISPPTKRGGVLYRGLDLSQLPPETIARSGIAYVPEDRRIFPELTVYENLKIAEYYSRRRDDGWTMKKIMDLFPVLEKRKENQGKQLSGGEQQMLAIARALMANPDLILMDEPSEGLAPLLVKVVSDTIIQIKRDGITVLLVEQNFDMSVELGNIFYIINKGQIVFCGSGDEIKAQEETRKQFLSV
jgi:branched-chain amino acid transport system ATP-binding protein